MNEGLLDTSVVVDLPRLVADPDALPEHGLISAVTMAELAQGPLFARSEEVRRARSRLLLEAYRAFPEPLAFDAACAAAYQSVAAVTVAAGRHPRGRTLDLFIAATAHAHGLPLVTRNPDDVDHLTGLIEVVAV